jgi:large subunit ribosomal protein L25
MEKIILKAAKRKIPGEKVNALRRQGKLPAVIYGHHIESTPIVLDAAIALPKLSLLTSSTTMIIDLDGKEYPAIVREKQRDPIKKFVTHLDFQVISLTEKMRAKVSIELSGTAPAEKAANAVILSSLNELEVESLPQDMPERFIVDIAGLAEIGDTIRVQDIPKLHGVAILNDPEEVIVTASAPTVERVVEEAAAEEAAPEGSAVSAGKKEASE